MSNNIKLNIGCGRMRKADFIGIDCVQIIDGSGNKMVDVVLDLDNENLPYEDSSVDEIFADSVLEHLDNLKHVLNECWRVLKPGKFLTGSVPICGTSSHWKDPTHRRCFIESTFAYFSGHGWKKGLPAYPRYADYGFKPWNLIKLDKHENGEILIFTMSPQK